MCAIEPRARPERDKKLRGVAIRARINHGELSGLRVFDNEVLVCVVMPVNDPSRLDTMRLPSNLFLENIDRPPFPSFDVMSPPCTTLSGMILKI
jgi:hypothetical protein